jgi:hypothetical protein
MAKNPVQPYQPILLRLLHGLTALSAILAMITALWTYNVYDGRWFKLPLPDFKAIEGIHGTFGLWSLLVFPLFVIYVFQQGKNRLIQEKFTLDFKHFNQKKNFYNFHRITNTLILLSLTFAVFSGKMMDEKWLPKGELNHNWYYGHLISWLILLINICFHLLMSFNVGGIPLILSMFNRKLRVNDHPKLWRSNLKYFKHNWRLILVKEWQNLPSHLKIFEVSIFMMIILSWLFSIFK